MFLDLLPDDSGLLLRAIFLNDFAGEGSLEFIIHNLVQPSLLEIIKFGVLGNILGIDEVLQTLGFEDR